MCLDMNATCSEYYFLLDAEYLHFLDCYQNDTDGTPKFSDDEENCYYLENLEPCGM